MSEQPRIFRVRKLGDEPTREVAMAAFAKSWRGVRLAGARARF
jgi:hypothetical protein